jgi:uncharacterized protein YbjQ (UPF0145 family)
MRNKLSPIILLNFIFLFGCAEPFIVQKTVMTSVYDFTSYTKKGFLFTSEQYLYDYESIGQISVEIIPDVLESSYHEVVGDEWTKKSGNSVWKVRKINPQEVLDELYNKAITMGADALVRLKFDSIEYWNGAIYFNSLQASGFAIKRK